MGNESAVTVNVIEAVPSRGSLKRALDRIFDKWFNHVDWLIRLRNQELLQQVQILLSQQGANVSAQLDAVNETLDELDRKSDSVVDALRTLEDRVNAGESVAAADLVAIRERLQGAVSKLDTAVTDANTPDLPSEPSEPETPVDPTPVDPTPDLPSEPETPAPPVDETPTPQPEPDPVVVEPELPIEEPAPSDPAPAEPTPAPEAPEDINNAPGAPDMGEGSLPVDQVPVDQTPADS